MPRWSGAFADRRRSGKMAGKIHHILCSMWQAAAKRNDRLFRKNADFSGWMSQKEAGFTEKQGNQYQPVTDGLVKVLKHFSISEKDAILDLGCGKGKAMYLMSRFSFGRIEGYDLSPELVRIANDNFQRLEVQKCRAAQGDAMDYDGYDDFNYFFTFNAFPQEVFEVMIGHVMASTRRKPRVCRFIYLHPVCHAYLTEHTPFRLIFRRKSLISWFDYYCYEYRPLQQ